MENNERDELVEKTLDWFSKPENKKRMIKYLMVFLISIIALSAYKIGRFWQCEELGGKMTTQGVCKNPNLPCSYIGYIEGLPYTIGKTQISWPSQNSIDSKFLEYLKTEISNLKGIKKIRFRNITKIRTLGFYYYGGVIDIYQGGNVCVLSHEIGHHVGITRYKNYSEEYANQYAKEKLGCYV